MAYDSADGDGVALETASDYSDGSNFPLEFNVLAAFNDIIDGTCLKRAITAGNRRFPFKFSVYVF